MNLEMINEWRLKYWLIRHCSSSAISQAHWWNLQEWGIKLIIFRFIQTLSGARLKPLTSRFTGNMYESKVIIKHSWNTNLIGKKLGSHLCFHITKVFLQRSTRYSGDLYGQKRLKFKSYQSCQKYVFVEILTWWKSAPHHLVSLALCYFKPF